MNEISIAPIANATGTPTKIKSGQSEEPVDCTPLVTEAVRSAGVVEPRKSMMTYMLDGF